jgi:hypothetical protein
MIGNCERKALFQLTGAVAIFIEAQLFSAGTCSVIDYVIVICAINNSDSNALEVR